MTDQDWQGKWIIFILLTLPYIYNIYAGCCVGNQEFWFILTTFLVQITMPLCPALQTLTLQLKIKHITTGCFKKFNFQIFSRLFYWGVCLLFKLTALTNLLVSLLSLSLCLSLFAVLMPVILISCVACRGKKKQKEHQCMCCNNAKI